MDSYLQKYLIKFSFCLLVFAALSILLILLVISPFLENRKGLLKTYLEDLTGENVSIKKIRYLPPGTVDFNGLVISQGAAGSSKEIASAGKVRVTFSLWKLLSSRELRPIAISIFKSKFDYARCQNCFKGNHKLETLLDSASSLKGNLNFKLKNGLLVFNNQGLEANYLIVDISLNNRKGTQVGSGSFSFDSFKKQSLNSAQLKHTDPVWKYYFELKDIKGITKIERLELKVDNFYLKLWGDLKDNTLKAYGFSYVGDFFRPELPSKAITAFKRKLNRIMPKGSRPMQIISGSMFDLNMMNINCVVRFFYPFIHIGNINFSINGMPCEISGNISFLNLVAVDLKLLLGLAPEGSTPTNDDKKIDIIVKGTFLQGKFNGHARANFLGFLKDANSIESIDGQFKNLIIHSSKRKPIGITADEAIITCVKDRHVFKGLFKGLNAKMNLLEKSVKSFVLNSGISGGRIDAKGALHLTQSSIYLTTDVAIQDVDISKVASVQEYFPNSRGILNGEAHYINNSEHSLSGNAIISGGYVENSVFFDWVADVFNISSLEEVDFDLLSADFLSDEEGFFWKNIVLDSPEVFLEGDYKLYSNELVSSRLSLALSKQTLRSSARFRPLLKLIEKDVTSLNLDFKLSGLSKAINFKWLESDFKKRLRDSIPNFIERGIERQVEKIINDSQ